ncbi:MAG: ParB/RepB/Spo0J family partition protein [Solirubrobacterales bacterium]
MAKRGMGRGLAAILPEPAGVAQAGLRHLPVEAIRPNPGQPRRRFDPDSISRLAASLAEAGVIQPLVVRPLDTEPGLYELIGGERRWRAAQEAGLDTVPTLVRDSPDAAELLQTALIENVSREDLNPIDEARALATLVEDLGVSKQEVGRRVGRSRSAVSNLIRLLDLPDDVLDLIEARELTEGHGRAILTVRGHEARSRLAVRAVEGGWSVRETERHVGGPANGSAGKRAALDADEEAALERVGDAFESALGRDISVRPARGGVRVELTFEDVDEALELAKRLGLG